MVKMRCKTTDDLTFVSIWHNNARRNIKNSWIGIHEIFLQAPRHPRLAPTHAAPSHTATHAPATMFWLLLLTAAAITIVVYRRKWRGIYKAYDDILLDIPSYPIIGHAYIFRGTDEDRMNSLLRIGRVALEKGGLSSIWLGHKLYVAIADPEAVEVVAKACLEKDASTMKYIRDLFGDGLAFAPALSDYANKTFLDLLIRLSGGQKGYSNLELREEILTLTIAATDTSATAVGYTLKMMAKYPHIQEKIHQELDEVFGDSDRLFEKEDLMRLTYLERVIKETLRLFPPVPFIIRRIDEETALPSGRVLPAGSGVAVSIWGTHRNPKYWGPDAEKFDPDRFLPERLKLKHLGAFMPFSNGPRNCIGNQYALMSIKTALSSVLRYNRVASDVETCASPQIRVKIDIMMKDVDEYEVMLEKRRPLPPRYTEQDS